jgi:uncharacterized membrane protein
MMSRGVCIKRRQQMDLLGIIMAAVVVAFVAFILVKWICDAWKRNVKYDQKEREVFALLRIGCLRGEIDDKLIDI